MNIDTDMYVMLDQLVAVNIRSDGSVKHKLKELGWQSNTEIGFIDAEGNRHILNLLEYCKA